MPTGFEDPSIDSGEREQQGSDEELVTFRPVEDEEEEGKDLKGDVKPSLRLSYKGLSIPPRVMITVLTIFLARRIFNRLASPRIDYRTLPIHDDNHPQIQLRTINLFTKHVPCYGSRKGYTRVDDNGITGTRRHTTGPEFTTWGNGISLPDSGTRHQRRSRTNTDSEFPFRRRDTLRSTVCHAREIHQERLANALVPRYDAHV